MITKSTGYITTIAGTGTFGYSGDNGLATAANLYFLYGIAVDTAGNIYTSSVDDYSRIRMITKSTGYITTIAGTGTYGYSGDNGPATAAQLRAPYGIALDTAGNIYLTDADNNNLRMVTRSTGIITTIAGSGTFGYSGDNGPATSAELYGPFGVALDTAGNIYIADAYNGRIRMVTSNTLTSTQTLTPSSAPTMVPTTAPIFRR